MDDSPLKKIGLVVLVILAVGAAIWSVMNFSKGPMDHTNMTPREMIEQERRNNPNLRK
jgi:hypothetical protein